MELDMVWIGLQKQPKVTSAERMIMRKQWLCVVGTEPRKNKCSNKIQTLWKFQSNGEMHFVNNVPLCSLMDSGIAPLSAFWDAERWNQKNWRSYVFRRKRTFFRNFQLSRNTTKTKLRSWYHFSFSSAHHIRANFWERSIPKNFLKNSIQDVLTAANVWLRPTVWQFPVIVEMLPATKKLQ